MNISPFLHFSLNITDFTIYIAFYRNFYDYGNYLPLRTNELHDFYQRGTSSI